MKKLHFVDMSTVKDIAELYLSILEQEDALEKEVMKPESRNPKGSPKKPRAGDPRPKDVGEQMLPPIDPKAHKGAQKTQKLYKKGASTTNPHEKEVFLKRTGPQLPLAKKKPSIQNSSFDQFDGDQLDEFVGGQKGDGYIGHPNLGIKNPLAKKKPISNPNQTIKSSNTGMAGKLGNRAAQTNAAMKLLRQSYELGESEESNISGKNLDNLRKKAVKRIDRNVSGFVDKNDKSMGSYGEFIPSPNGKKRLFTKINNEEYILERGMSSKDTYNILKNHKYTKQELWDMQRKATERGDHGVAHGIYSRWKEMKNEEYISEREMTASEKRKESRLKKKFDDSEMKQNMIDQYGEEKGTQIYFAKIRKMAMEEVDYNEVYEYIIDTLVFEEFAEDINAAEMMFECISDEFTAAIIEEYLDEKARGTRPKRTVHAYDVDETLFGHGKKGKPNVKVHVKDDSGKRVQSLSNQEFNTHKLKPGHKYDFGEFQSAKKFRETSSPNKKVIKDIKRKQARGQNVHLVTARSKFDNPSEFQGHLKKHGVNVNKSNIHYTGGMKGGDVGQKKVKVVDAVAKKAGAKKAHMYDDAAKVHKGFEAAKKDKPTSMDYKTHMVSPDKSGESRVRSYQATKGGSTGGQPKTTKEKQRARKKARRSMSEEMTPYDYWKQFID